MSYPPRGRQRAQVRVAVNRWHLATLCTAGSRVPSPPCTAFLTDHHTLKLATFVCRTDVCKTLVAASIARTQYTSLIQVGNARISCRAGWGDGEPRVAKIPARSTASVRFVSLERRVPDSQGVADIPIDEEENVLRRSSRDMRLNTQVAGWRALRASPQDSPCDSWPGAPIATRPPPGDLPPPASGRPDMINHVASQTGTPRKSARVAASLRSLSRPA